MNQLLAGQEGYACAYLNDIAVFSQSLEAHIHHLKRVFCTLEKVGLHASWEKCQVAMPSIRYLEHVVGSGRHGPAKEKIEAIEGIQAPKTKKELRSTLGLCGYYRSYVPNFAEIALPLTRLTGKGVQKKIPWPDDADKPLKALKKALSEAVSLTIPDPRKPYLLFTDAAAVAVGACLAQLSDNDTEAPIAFASHKFTPSQMRASERALGSKRPKQGLQPSLQACSLHFRPENYREGLKLRRLKPDAVPTVFPAFPVYLQPSPNQTRRLLKRKFPASAPSVSESPGLVKNDSLLYKVQERQGAFKMVLRLTKKHLWPSNFEKMNVSRAVDIFSPQVTSVLRFLQQHRHRLGAPGFEDCLPTVEFMETVYKWFSARNIKSTTFCTASRDAWKMPFYSASDERLQWLEAECLDYFASWKEGTIHKLEYLTVETHEALTVTTKSTVMCTKHLLNAGFHFVLTGKFSSDDVESLFSAVRQLNGSNDQTDADSALSALQKILVTGIIHSSPRGSVGSVVASLGAASRLPAQTVTKATAGKDVGKFLLPYLSALERYPSLPPQSLRSSTLALIAGFLVRAVQDNIDCLGCIDKLRAPTCTSTTTALIAGINRGELSYPTLAFVGFVSILDGAASKAVQC
ncbi:hypothetical protein V5799_013673 [Amblyomma americanum]|uniref:RNA-directed DNA polymerase n=1 Tax=Amblyomma americanum TaxID=6943 RepID=A0AAQ4E5A3_AMBAM